MLVVGAWIRKDGWLLLMLLESIEDDMCTGHDKAGGNVNDESRAHENGGPCIGA